MPVNKKYEKLNLHIRYVRKFRWITMHNVVSYPIKSIHEAFLVDRNCLPKSSIASLPSGVRIRFPGCGSAWKKPVSSSYRPKLKGERLIAKLIRGNLKMH